MPDTGHVISQPFIEPDRYCGLGRRPRNDVEHEDVGDLVGDPISEIFWRFIDKDHDPIALWLRKGTSSGETCPRRDALLLKVAAGLEKYKRYVEGQLMCKLRAHELVRALRQVFDPLEIIRERGKVVDVETVGFMYLNRTGNVGERMT